MNSVTRQVIFDRTKTGRNCQNSLIQMRLWVDKTWSKMPKPEWSNSVTRQVNLKRTKIGGKCQNSICDNLINFQTLWTCIQKHSVNCPLQSSIPKKCALRSSVHTYPLNLSKTENNIPHLHFFRRNRFSKTTSYAIDWKSPVFLGYKRVLLPRTSSTEFENYRKSRIQHCERSELSFHLEWTKT